MNKMEKALKVITLDKNIVAFLEQNDPMALKQCREALEQEGSEEPVGNIVLQIQANQERVEDLIVDALEGGSNYWYRIKRYVYPEGKTKETIGLDIHTEYAKIPFMGGSFVFDVPEDEDGKEYIFDREAIVKGLHIMANKYTRHYADWLQENDDAITADVFLQCCLFGEVIYG